MPDIYVDVNPDGTPAGFYREEIHGLPGAGQTPAGSIVITEAQWLTFLNNQGRKRWSGVDVEDIPATVATAKRDKLEELEEEFLSRARQIYPILERMDQIKLVRDQFLSVAPAARQPTVDFQKLIDTYQAAIAARSAIQAMSDVPTIQAYDVTTAPGWPA